MLVTIGIVLACVRLCFSQNRELVDNKALAAAERLAWLRNWSAAQPYFAEAEHQFEAAGDRRNFLFAHISAIRADLQRRSLPETSELLGTLLEDQLVQSDARLRLRCLVVKGDVDLDLDTDLARRDWTEARSVADSLGEAGWANRARGELAVVSFLQGNHEAAALAILAAIQKARQIGDISSVVRYETLVGDGLVQWKQYDKALSYFDSALQIAKSEPDIQYPLLLYSGRIEALIGLGRASEATELLKGALVAAKKTGAIGYQSELHFRYGLLDIRQGLQAEALQELRIATELGDSINSPRLAAQSTFTLAKCLESKGDLKEAVTAINASVQRSRQAGDRIMLPETLAEAARIQTALGHSSLADRYFDEASEIASGVLGSVANLTGKDEFINSLDRLYLDHFRFHANKREVDAAFNVAEQVHGRAVADLLRVGLTANKGTSAQRTPGEKRIAHLQLALMNSTNRGDRTRLLASLASAEEEAYPSFVDGSASTRRVGDTPIALHALQQSLGGADMLLEYFLANPQSYCILVTQSSAHICELPSKDQIDRLVDNHLNAIASRRDVRDSGRQLFKTILPPESMTTSNLIVVPDGALHRLPFDTMVDDRGEFLLATHSVSYVPSATVLGLLSKRSVRVSGRPLLAVSAGTDEDTGSESQATRGMFDLGGLTLPRLTNANNEARTVGEIWGPNSVVITGSSATESAVKAQPLDQFRILHFAVHSIMSPSRPERAGLVFFPSADGSEDGLWQVREIERTRLRAELVTLSACRGGDGRVMGSAGIESLVTPFLAAGAEAVLANLWEADDTFTAMFMPMFYTHLHEGRPTAAALRQTKLDIIARYGAAAPANLWAGFVLNGVSRQVFNE